MEEVGDVTIIMVLILLQFNKNALIAKNHLQITPSTQFNTSTCIMHKIPLGPVYFCSLTYLLSIFVVVLTGQIVPYRHSPVRYFEPVPTQLGQSNVLHELK